MGKILKVIGGVIGGLVALVILALIIVPTFFSDDVEAYAKRIVNEYVKDAKVDFGDFSLSIFSSFPSLRAGIDQINIIGQGRFEGDTLLHVGKLYADLDVMKAINGDIQINAVSIDDVLAHGIVTADSLANWDIVALDSDTTATEESDTTAASPLRLNLEKVELSNVRLAYTDSTANISAGINGLNATMNGEMNGNVMGLTLKLVIDAINAGMGGTNYVSNANLNFDAKAVADLDSMKFVFDENKLTFAGLPLAFDGWVQVKDSNVIALDMKLAALQTTFKAIMDLIPAEFLKGVSGLKTTGTFELYAKAAGEYKDMDNIPAIDALLRINDGYVKYPDLPKSVDNINVAVVVNNPGGSADLTTVSVDTLHFALGGNPFDIKAHVRTPMSNLVFDAAMLGKLNLGSLKDALPLDSMEIAGIVDADLRVAGDLASIDKQQYEKVNAQGKIGLTNFKFTGSALPQGLDVPQALLTFSPKAVNLNPLDVKIGKSDISLKGNVEDYLGYALSDGTLKGSASLTSKLLDCNELLTIASAGDTSADSTSQQATTQAKADTTAAEPLVLPTNIDFAFNTDIDKLLYDKLELTNISGRVALKNGIADLSNLSTDICDGKLVLNGKFQTPKDKDAKIDMKLDFNNVDINKLTGSFSVVDSMLPIAHNAYGKVSIGLDITSDLDPGLSPILKSVNGKGSFASSSIMLKDSEVQQNLAKLLANDKYKEIDLKDCKINFTIEDGNVVVTPFNINIFGKKSTFSGKQGLDQSMDYALEMPVARKEIASVIGKLGASATTWAEGDDLPVGVKIAGTISKPQIKLDLSEVTSSIANEAKSKATEKATEAVDKAISNIKDEKTKDAVNKAKNALDGLLKKKK